MLAAPLEAAHEARLRAAHQLVDTLGLRAQAAPLRREDAVSRRRLHARAHPRQPQAQGRVAPLLEGGDPGLQLLLGLHHPLGGGRGCRGAQVGHEVGDRVVRLVAHRRDRGDAGRGDRPGHRLLVEGPEVLEAAAAAGEDDHVESADAVERPDPLHDLGRGTLALHEGGVDEHLEVGVARAKHAQDVAQHRAGGRGDDPDPARQHRERPLAGRVEEPLLLEPLLQLLEGLLERALAERLEDLDARSGTPRGAGRPAPRRGRAPSSRPSGGTG